jgi:hypothetical protein
VKTLNKVIPFPSISRDDAREQLQLAFGDVWNACNDAEEALDDLPNTHREWMTIVRIRQLVAPLLPQLDDDDH